MSGEYVLRPVGDMDFAGAGRFRAEWYALIDERLPARVLVDLRNVTFMDSAGLSVLAGLARRQQARGGTVAVSHVPTQIAKIMMVTGLDRSVRILWSDGTDDPDEASVEPIV